MKANIQKSYKLFIGGQWVDGRGGETFGTYCPANGELISTCAVAAKEDVDAAVKAAWKAYAAWKDTSVAERSRMLIRLADLIEENAEKLAWIETMDNGMPIRSSRIFILKAADRFRYFGAVVQAQEGGATFLNKDTLALHIHEPIGVVGQIVPWNAPFISATSKLAPPLAVGDTVVIKASSETPLSLLELAKIAQEVLPPGVINVINGPGSTTGQYLLDHPDIVKLSFTGSTEVGYSVARAAADKLIPATLELGGKSANIFFADCPWKKAVEGMALGILNNSGQICTSGSRAFVHQDIYDKFMAEVVEMFDKVPVGLPWDEGSTLGPVISESQMNKILEYIEIGRKEGAELACGGKTADRQGPGQGLLHRPHHPDRGGQQDEGGPGGDLRPGSGGDQVQGRGGGHPPGQRQPLWPGRRGLDQRPQPGHPGLPGHPDRLYLGQLLRRPDGPHPLWRLQAVRAGQGEPPGRPGALRQRQERRHQPDRGAHGRLSGQDGLTRERLLA